VQRELIGEQAPELTEPRIEDGAVEPGPCGAPPALRSAGQHLAHVALVVRTRTLRREQVARDGVVTAREEGVTDHAGELAGDQDAH
jgi:hypothetical protein